MSTVKPRGNIKVFLVVSFFPPQGWFFCSLLGFTSQVQPLFFLATFSTLINKVYVPPTHLYSPRAKPPPHTQKKGLYSYWPIELFILLIFSFGNMGPHFRYSNHWHTATHHAKAIYENVFDGRVLT